jgi:hypothetical protein
MYFDTVDWATSMPSLSNSAIRLPSLTRARPGACCTANQIALPIKNCVIVTPARAVSSPLSVFHDIVKEAPEPYTGESHFHDIAILTIVGLLGNNGDRHQHFD